MQIPHIEKWLKFISKPKPLFTSTLSSSSTHPILPFLLQALNHHHHCHDLKALHAHFITSGLIADPFAASRLIQFCLQSTHESLHYATSIFHSLQTPDVYTWNLMIASHVDFGLSDKSIAFYFKMRASEAPPNTYTFALVVKACIGNGGEGKVGLGLRRLVHGQVLKCGVEDLVVVKNSLLSMYCNLGLLGDARVLFERSRCLDLISWNIMISACGKNGDVEIARKMFEKMSVRSLFSWSALIDGYVRKGDFHEALSLFDRLQDQGVEPDEAILVSVLKSCAHLGAIYQGRAIHRYIDQYHPGRHGNVVLQTALVDMYCKCGCIDVACQVFDRVQNRDVVLWNAMIGGLAMHGATQNALELFETMRWQNPNVIANETTYLNVLCACTHGGLVDEGIEIFESMKENGVEPLREHYGCLADLMGRAGRLREAEEVLLTMPMEPQASQWGALMSACQMHKNVEVGERVGRKMIKLEPLDGGRYVLLANLYAAVGEWEKAKEVRREMEERGTQKETGLSLV